MAPLLEPLHLEEDAFDYLSYIAELDKNGETILDSEWREFYSIIVGRIKKYVQYEIWRKEEARDPSIPESGITLSPEYFRLRPAPFAGGALEWVPERWRASTAARQKWENTLRSRIEQEQAVIAGLREAVDATEEAVLVRLRDELRIEAGTVGNIHLRTPNALTGYLQIDVQAGGCHMTTRVAQAIETVQGLLFGARNGLLEDDSLTRDADNFDEEWKWIGSYATWRAAMQVFLYPENALRPTLRNRKSEAFEQMIHELRGLGRNLTAVTVLEQAVKYNEFFRDVCSLSMVGLCETAGVISGDISSIHSPSAPGRGDVFGVGRGGQTGKFYFSVWKKLHGWGLKGSPDQTSWRAVRGLPANSEMRGLLPYHNPQGNVQIGMYFRARKGSVYEYHFATYNETEAKVASQLDDWPALVQTAQYAEGTIPCSPALLSRNGNPWQLHADDQLVPIDVDGDGRAELIMLAGQSGPAGRRVGLVREHGGACGLIGRVLSIAVGVCQTRTGRSSCRHQFGR